jgi:hypothetical protein
MQNNASGCLASEIEYYDNSKWSYTISFIIVFLRLAAGWKKKPTISSFFKYSLFAVETILNKDKIISFMS